jgi:phosphoribosylamine--glycine ligase
MKKNLRVLFVSGEMIGADVCRKLKDEGCEVKLFIFDETRRDCFDGIVEKTDDWRKELDWVGKDGLVVIDDVGYGDIVEELRGKGFNVFGSNVAGDRLEKDRNYAQKIFSISGMKIASSIDFDSMSEAKEFIIKHKGRWVVKQNGHEGSLSYVGELDNGADTISMLNSYDLHNNSESFQKVSLQKIITGVEIAVARYFNGKDWVGPSLISFEHKPLLDNDKGPLTAEMGTLAWHDSDENSKLFKNTIGLCTGYLREIDYRGYVDINSILNEDGIFPLEATMRFGSPTNYMQTEMYLSPWHELLLAVAKGEQYDLKYKGGYSIVVSIAIPPFPYKAISADYYIKGYEIVFKEELSEREKEQLHFEEVSGKEIDGVMQYYVAGSNGYIMFVTGTGDTVKDARKDAYRVVDKIVIPKKIYREDIGVRFINRDEALLKKWGWV